MILPLFHSIDRANKYDREHSFQTCPYSKESVNSLLSLFRPKLFHLLMSIFILSRPANLLLSNGSHMTDHNKQPQNKQDSSLSRPSSLTSRTIQPLPNLHSRNSKPSVRENISIPIEVEIIPLNPLNGGDESNGKKPEGQCPYFTFLDRETRTEALCCITAKTITIAVAYISLWVLCRKICEV